MTDPFYAVEIWDDLEAAGGVRKAVVPLIEGSMTRGVDNIDRLTFSGLDSTEWVPHATLRSVARVRDWLGNAHEWRISERQRSVGEEDGVTTIQALSPLTDLGLVDLIHDESTGGQKWFNLGGVGLTPSQYLESFALPALERHGSTYTQIGTVESTEPRDVAWDRWTPLQLAQELRDRAEAELEYVRIGSTGYNLNLLSERGSTADTRLLRVGRNLQVLRWRQQLEHLRTVVVPTGKVVPGAVESAGIQQAAWRSVTATLSTDGGTIELADPSSGDGPVQFNDQVTGLWLASNTNSPSILFEITSSTTDQVVRYGPASTVPIGSRYQFRSSSDGRYLTELTNPAQAASSAYGRIVALLNLPELRGEANLVLNGLFSPWANRPDMFAGVADGGSSSPGGGVLQVDVKDLPASLAINGGDVLRTEAGSTSTVGTRRINADVTASTAGAVTLTFLSTVGSIANGEVVFVNRRETTGAASRLPNGISADAHLTNTIVVLRRDPSIAGDLSGNSNGTNGGTTGARYFDVSNLPESAEIQAGDVLLLDSTGHRFRVCGSVTATTDGDARVPIFRKSGLPLAPTTTDGAPVTIERPTVFPTQPLAQFYMAMHAQNVDLTTEAGVEQRPYCQDIAQYVRHDSTLPVMWATLGVSYHAITAQTLTSTSTSFSSLRMDVWDVATSSAFGSVTDEDRTLSAMVVQNGRVQAAVTLSSDSHLRMRAYPPTGTNLLGEPWVFFRYMSMTLSPDPDTPPIDGSFANRLWQDGNRKLLDWSRDPDVFEVAIRDLSAVEGYTSTDEALILGGTVTLFDPDLDINKNLRVVQITHDLVEPSNTRVLLANRPKLLTDRPGSRSQTRVPVYVDVAGTTSTGGQAGAGAGIPISTSPSLRTSVSAVRLDAPNEMLPRQTGAYRAVAPSSGSSTGSIVRQVFSG